MTRWRWILLLVAAIAAALTARWAWLEHAAQGFPKRRDAAAPATVVVEPLARRPDDNGPQNAGAARFVRLPASATHVEFTNLLRKENCYQYLTNGAGCAAGDYDGDGLVDLYLVSQDGENRLYRQTAPLVFEDVTRSAGGLGGGDAWGTGASFADVDGDGDLDLYVCNLEARNLLYENQGDGTFRENAAKFGLDIAAASMMCAFCDYDRDGSLDLYLLTNRALHAGWAQTPPVLDGFTPGKDTLRSPRAMVPTLEQAAGIGDLLRQGALTDANIPAELREHYFAFRGRHYMTGQQDRLLRNVGGRFVDVSSSAGIAGHGMGLSASWCDYDGDGWPDLYVCDDLESPDKLYQNQRDGTFRNVTADVVPHTAYYGMGSDWGDVDGDGSMDLIVADMSMTTHEKAKVLMGDMDNQRPVLMHWQPPQYMRNALLVNTGLGRFQEAGKLAGVASTDWTWSVLFGDLDNDARLDLLATNGIARFDTDPDLALAVDDLWQKQRYEAAYQLIQNVRRVPEQNLAFRNTGDLAFQRASDWGLELEAVTHGALLVDLDGDGDLDVVLNNWNEPAAIYENRTDDGRGVIVRLRGQQSERFGIGARVTLELDDGTELVRENWLSRGYLSGQCPELHFGVGSHRVAALTVRWPSGHVQRHSEAFDAPARVTCTEPPGSPAQRDAGVSPPTATLFRPAAAAPARHVENDFDEYVAQPLLPEEVGKLGPGLAFGDGGSLLFVGGARGRAGSLWRDAGNGDWREVKGPWQQDARCEDLAVLFFDADGDGDEDLFVSSGGAEAKPGSPELQDRLYRNDGVDSFTRTDGALPDVRESSGHAAACDFDHDGDLDLFVAGRLVPGSFPDAPPSRLYRNDGGRFTDASAELAPALATAGMVTSALFTDVDGDGWSDLLLAAQWQPIRLLKNTDGRFTDVSDAAGLLPHSGWWNSLCAFDVDDDGDLDYVAGNRGLNTKYKASAEHPAKLFFADFDQSGTRDLVEAKYGGDTLLPVRGRSCSSGAMPFLKQKFPTYEKFAKSTLAEIYSPEQLESCDSLSATTLASCLLRNDGSGRFTLEPLPRRAQLAPIFGMVALGDLLVCAENSYAPEPETGRHDGGTGLVLRAVNGRLEVVPVREHGICFFGDRKALAARRGGEGAVELVFSCNDGPLVAYSTAGRALDGTFAPGTRLSFELPGGKRRAAEVSAGAGYLSQSAAIVVPSAATAVGIRAPGREEERRELR